MSLSISPSHLRRYKDVVRLLAKYGDASILRPGDLEEAVVLESEVDSIATGKKPEQLAADLEALGPTFVKLGQLLSTRGDLLPLPYLKALSRLQDRVEPFPYEEVEPIVEEELGIRISKAFLSFTHEPVAAASLGQVHKAVMRDGRTVAVKIQRPDIRRTILTDLESMEEIADFLDHHTEAGRRYSFSDMFAQFRKALIRELDYRQEAQNLITIGANLAHYRRIVVPQPVLDYTTSKILTMDFVRGWKITKLSPVVRTELDGSELTEQLSKAYLDQVLVDGFFHADPHPGNIFVTEDHQLALLDLGMVARLESSLQEHLLRLLISIVNGDGKETAKISKEIGVTTDTFNPQNFEREVSDMILSYQHATLEQINVGRIVVEIARISGQCGVRPPPELTMLGKTLLNLDEVGRILAPDFDPNTVVREHVESILRRRMIKRLSPANVFSTALEVNEFVQELPSRLNSVFRLMADNEFQIRVDAVDEVRLLRNFHSIANRIALSVVLAALIMGAALMMRVETAFTILGYPGIAMILFLGAAACGFFLVFSILFGEKDASTKQGGRT